MPDIKKDDRIILTLDAGGTNFDFAALRGGAEATDPVRLPSNGHDLEKCIQTIKDGFNSLLSTLGGKPSAISFAFPGPADYEQGIIGDLGNLPCFRGGIPLKSILEKEFELPVFINNDANLFVYGEALGGLLPRTNAKLEQAGNPKRYSNLVGVTLGTGFGGGFVSNGNLLIGDNSLGGEIWLTSSRVFPENYADEMMSIRAIRSEYAQIAGIHFADAPPPKQIAAIARGDKVGDIQAAKGAFAKLGSCLGDVLANLITLYDGLVVIGGGIAYTHDLFFPSMFAQWEKPFENAVGMTPRLVQKVFNLQDEQEVSEFLKPRHKTINWPGIEAMEYNPEPSLAVGITTMGTRKATALGAYAFALDQL